MADTERTIAELLSTYFPDNVAGDISPQDCRDLLVSLRGGYCSAYHPGASPSVSNNGTTTGLEFNAGSAIGPYPTANSPFPYNNASGNPGVSITNDPTRIAVEVSGVYLVIFTGIAQVSYTGYATGHYSEIAIQVQPGGAGAWVTQLQTKIRCRSISSANESVPFCSVGLIVAEAGDVWRFTESADHANTSWSSRYGSLTILKVG